MKFVISHEKVVWAVLDENKKFKNMNIIYIFIFFYTGMERNRRQLNIDGFGFFRTRNYVVCH